MAKTAISCALPSLVQSFCYHHSLLQLGNKDLLLEIDVSNLLFDFIRFDASVLICGHGVHKTMENHGNPVEPEFGAIEVLAQEMD